MSFLYEYSSSKKIPAGFTDLLLFGDTRLVRFWFSIISFGWAIWIFNDTSFTVNHEYILLILPKTLLVILFSLYSFSLLYGVITTRYNSILLFFEGILGTFLWCGLGIADTFQHHTLSPTFFSGILALYLLIRYPINYKNIGDANAK
jgi:hypothetical protein